MALSQADKTKPLNWINTPQSSNVKAFAYDGKLNRLYVRFKGGGGGYYGAITYDVYYRMVKAVSKGKFVHRVLKPTYPWTAT